MPEGQENTALDVGGIVNNFWAENWDSVLSGAASGVGFLIGGPAGAFLLGGAVGFIGSMVKNKGDVAQAAVDAVIGGGAGLIGGGFLGGWGTRSAGKMLTRMGWNSLAKTVGKSTLGQTVKGGVAAFAAPMVGRGVKQYVVNMPGSIPVVNYTAGVAMMAGVPVQAAVYGPDPKAHLPNGLVLSSGAVDAYQRLCPMTFDAWNLFGDSAGTNPPQPKEVSQTTPNVSKINTYEAAATALRASQAKLNSAGSALPAVMTELTSLVGEAKAALELEVRKLKGYAATNPSNSPALAALVEETEISSPTGTLSEDEFVTQLASSFSSTVTALVKKATATMEQLAAQIPKPAGTGTTAGAGTQEPGTKQSSGTAGAGTTLGPGYGSYSPFQQGTASPAGLGQTSSAGTLFGSNQTSPSGSRSNPYANTTAVNGQPTQGLATPTSGSSPMSSAMLPLLAELMKSRSAGPVEPKHDEDGGRDASRQDHYLGGLVVAPGQLSPGAAAGQQPGKAATQAPAGKPSATGKSAAAGVRPTAGSARVSTPDGGVEYRFPDGRAQRVSLVVADALDAAFANKAGTDARSAYGHTPARWRPGTTPGGRVDPYQLITGDVAEWDHRTAVVVAFPTDRSATLDVVIEGRLHPFTPEMSDSNEPFGQFAGFAHPAGIEVTAPGLKPAPATDDVAPEPSYAATLL